MLSFAGSGSHTKVKSTWYRVQDDKGRRQELANNNSDYRLPPGQPKCDQGAAGHIS